MYYLIPTLGHSGKGKAMHTAERSAVVKLMGEGRDEKPEPRGTAGGADVLFKTTMEGTRHCTFVRTHRIHSEPYQAQWHMPVIPMT